MNLQTSFLTPPFGFALFYLRSVAAKFDYKDRVTGQLIPSVKTSEIYKGSIAFIILQLIMVVSVIAFPVLVTGGMSKDKDLSAEQIMQQLEMPPAADAADPTADTGKPATDAPAEGSKAEDDDPMKALMDDVAKGSGKKP
jgi:hypothetical protein